MHYPNLMNRIIKNNHLYQMFDLDGEKYSKEMIGYQIKIFDFNKTNQHSL